MSKLRRIWKQREHLLKKYPYCHWCEIRLVSVRVIGKNKHYPANMATIDHLDPRGSPQRGQYPPGQRRRVLACLSCNNNRDRKRVAEIPIQSRWEKYGQLYSIAKYTGALNEVEG